MDSPCIRTSHPTCLRVSSITTFNPHRKDDLIISCLRFPKSLSYVIIDTLEKIYLAGFPLLQLFVMLFPTIIHRRATASIVVIDVCIPSVGFSCPEPEHKPKAGTGIEGMEFLPLMLTSVYCAAGLVWAFLRLFFVYMKSETTYQGQLSGI
jgi:alpha-1,3-glucosyltransferase